MKLSSMTLQYEQEADSCDPDIGGTQVLSVELTDAGGGPYAVIETSRWALDAKDIDAFAAELKRRIAEVEKAQE